MQYLNEERVASMLTISRATIYRMVRAGKFPKPIYISARRKVWSLDALQSWLSSKDTESTQPAEAQQADYYAGLGSRARHALRHMWDEPVTKESLSEITDSELLRCPNIGRVAVRQIREWQRS